MRPKLAICLLLSAWPVRAGELTGRLTLNEKPAAGITVSALPVELPAEQTLRESRREPRPAALAKAVTNAKGEFRLVFEIADEVPGRLVALAYAGPGVASAWVGGRYDTSDVDDVGEVSARKGIPLAGRVSDAEGRPVADADVDHPTGPGSMRTGADGRFSLEGAAESGNDLEVSKPGFATVKVPGVRGGRSDVSAVLRRALPLAGIVVAADGTPAANVPVRVDGAQFRASGETDAEGRFRIVAFGPGRVSVLADAGERGLKEITGVALPRPEDPELRLVLASPRVFAGRVVDVVTRRPVPRAVVDVLAGKLRLWTRTGPDGSFTLRPAPSGDFRLSSSAPRYVMSVRQVSRSDAAGRTVELLLRPAATLSGRVLDEQRRPVAGVKLQAWDPEVRQPPLPPPSARTAEDGSFTLRRVLAAETVKLAASHPDFEPVALGDLGLKPGETRAGLAISLRRGAVVTGVVTAGGEPLAGVQVSVSPGRSAYGTPPRSLATPQWAWPRATTGADGRFRIGGLSPGEYSVSAGKTGWATESRDATVAEGRGPDPFAFALWPEAVVSGRVVGKKGGAVAVQSISAQAVDVGARSSGYARSAPDGTFRIEGLRKGVGYNLFIWSPSSNAPKATVTPPAESVELVVDGLGRVAGRVVDPDGQPVTEYQVTVQSDRSAGTMGAANSVRQDVASETGEFSVDNAPAGALEVRVVAKGFQAARVGGIALEEGAARAGVEVKLARGAALKGRVVDARGGGPVAGADVSAESAPSRATTDSEGAFAFDALSPGKVRVTATSPDYASAAETVDVGESGGSVELKMSIGASISAAVVSPGGDPVPGAEVTLAPAGQQSWSNNRLTAGPDGRVRFPHLSPGRFTMTAGSAGRRSKPVDVTLEADQVRDDVRLVLGGGATVVVTVTGLSPEERRQVNVGVSGRSYLPGQEMPDGRFEIHDVPSGRAQAYARVGSFGEPNSRNGSRPVTVPEDGTVDVEIPFEGGFALTVHVLKDGQGVEGAYVFASASGGANATASGSSDASGICRLIGLKAGTYRLDVGAWTLSTQSPETKVELTGDQTVEMVLPSGRLAGRVIASGSQQPLADAIVTVRSGPQADGSPGYPHEATTDDTGRFQFSGLEAGPLTLSASRKGYVVETRTVSADSPDDVVLALARGDGLDVTGLDGILRTPLQSFTVTVYDAAGTQVLVTVVRLDSAGRGEIPSLKPGTYTIVAGAWNGLAPSTYEGVTVPGPALAVALTPGGTLDVDVPADKLKTGPLSCVVNGPRGRITFRMWGNRGELQVSQSSMHLANFPPVAGTLSCPGSAPVPFTVTEGGTARVSVR